MSIGSPATSGINFRPEAMGQRLGAEGYRLLGILLYLLTYSPWPIFSLFIYLLVGGGGGFNGRATALLGGSGFAAEVVVVVPVDVGSIELFP